MSECCVLHTHRAVSAFTPQRSQKADTETSRNNKSWYPCCLLEAGHKSQSHPPQAVRNENCCCSRAGEAEPPLLCLCLSTRVTPSSPAKIRAGSRCFMQILQSNEGKVPPLSAPFWLGWILIWTESSFENVWVWFWEELTQTRELRHRSTEIQTASVSMSELLPVVLVLLTDTSPQWKCVLWAGHWWHLPYSTIAGLMTNILQLFPNLGASSLEERTTAELRYKPCWLYVKGNSSHCSCWLLFLEMDARLGEKTNPVDSLKDRSTAEFTGPRILTLALLLFRNSLQ